MVKMSFAEFILPLVKSMDTYNYLLKSHHRRVAVIAHAIGKQMRLKEHQLIDLVIAASLHDVGALSVQDRDQLLEVDVSDPKPHCEMGYEILRGFDRFADIAHIVKHHHIFYDASYLYDEEIKIQSHILHVADRVDVYMAKDKPILAQREAVLTEVRDRKGTLLHPQVCGAFELASRSSNFWLDIKNKSLDELFDEIDYGPDIEVTPSMIKGLSVVLARIVDYRSRYTAAHSLTVGNLAQFIGELLHKEDEFKTQLLVAGLLHDVGKIGINPSLITKEGSLNQEEYDQIRQVPRYNERILKDMTNSPWFEPVLDWISTTNPAGDSMIQDQDGHQLGTMIIELSHMMTALLEDRPYRESYDMDKALDILKQETSTQSEYDMVEFLSKHKEEINTVIKKYHAEGMDFYDNIQREFEYY